MSQTLSEQTVAIVKATVPALNAHGLDIVNEMYSRLFQNPEIRDMFNQSHQGLTDAQPRALTAPYSLTRAISITLAHWRQP